MNKQLDLFDDQPVEKTGIDTFVYYIVEAIRAMDRDAAIEAINQVKIKLHEVSPFASEPVD